MAKSTKNSVKVEEQKLLKTVIERITLLRTAQDIQRWRSAVRQAEGRERPDRVRLYEIYKEVVDDDQVIAVMQKIIYRCTNHRIWWKVDGNRADLEHPLNQLAKMGFFRKLVEYILESVWWGHSLIALNFLEASFMAGKDEGVELVHRPNVRPEQGDILLKQGQEKDAIQFRMAPAANFLLEVGERRNLGLLNPVCPIVLAKRQGFVNWTDFLERYGMPIPAVAYDPNNPSNRAEAEKAIATFGSNAGVVYPNGGSFSLHDSAKAGNSQAFELKARYHDDSISKIFLLGTMTTDSGASLSQANVHQQGEDEAVWAYQSLVETVLNEKLLELLRMHGWKVEENGAFQYGDTERLKKAALADIIAKVSAVADIPMSYVYERFNIPEPGPGDKIAQNIPVTSQQPDLGAGKKKMTAEGAGRLNLPSATTDPCCITGSLPLTKVSDLPTSLAFDPTKVTKQEKDLLSKIWEGVTSSGQIPRQHFQELHSLLTSGIEEGYPEPKTDWNSPDHLRRSLMEANVQRFSAAKDLVMVQQLNELKNSAKDFKDFNEAAKPLLVQYQEHWLKTEYDHAVASSQNAAAYLRQLDNADLYPYWRYQTVGDDRVRDAHAALDGKVFRLDDPEGLRFYPPNGYNCRCEAIPTDEGDDVASIEDAIQAIGGEQWDKMRSKGFDTNPGDTLKLFSKNMEYLQGFDPNALSFRSFLLPEFKDKASLPRLDLKPMNSKEASAWFEQKRGDLGLDSSDAVRFEDYRQRPIELHGNLVADLVVKAQASLLNEVQTVLEKPDEVWMEEGNAFVRKYLKFYEGKAIALDVIFSKGNPERIKHLNLLDDNSGASIDAVRRGILAYFRK